MKYRTRRPGETSAFKPIATSGANAVRVVLSEGQQWSRDSAADVARGISLCKEHELIGVLEAHDVTGSRAAGAAGSLANAARYWVAQYRVDSADVLHG